MDVAIADFSVRVKFVFEYHAVTLRILPLFKLDKVLLHIDCICILFSRTIVG